MQASNSHACCHGQPDRPLPALPEPLLWLDLGRLAVEGALTSFRRKQTAGCTEERLQACCGVVRVSSSLDLPASGDGACSTSSELVCGKAGPHGAPVRVPCDAATQRSTAQSSVPLSGCYAGAGREGLARSNSARPRCSLGLGSTARVRIRACKPESSAL